MNPLSSFERRALLSAAGVGAIAALSKAGPLDPPAGSVTPTGRTLDEVYDKIPTLPGGGSGDGRTPIPGGAATVAITQPGSYVLTGNISAVNGIVIAADDVTLDLNGYRIASTTTTGLPIGFSGARSNVTIRNGTLTGGQGGVVAAGVQVSVLLEDLRIVRTRMTGIMFSDINSRSCTIRRCHVSEVGGLSTSSDPALSVSAITLGGDAHRVDSCTVSRVFNNSVGGSIRGIVVTGNGANSGVLVERCLLTHDLNLNGTGLVMSNGGGVYRDNTVMLFTTPYSVAGNVDGGGNV